MANGTNDQAERDKAVLAIDRKIIILNRAHEKLDDRLATDPSDAAYIIGGQGELDIQISVLKKRKSAIRYAEAGFTPPSDTQLEALKAGIAAVEALNAQTEAAVDILKKAISLANAYQSTSSDNIT